MKKFALIIIMIFTGIMIIGCGKKAEEETLTAESPTTLISKTYLISGDINYDLSLYGKVVSNDIKNITTTRAGKISQLECQPGTKVNKGTLIATITPDAQDANIQNIEIQKSYISEQIKNLEGTLSSTKQNFDIQINQLYSQKDNNAKQTTILEENLNNLNKQKTLSSGDINIQVDTINKQLQSLNDQLTTLNDNKSKDIAKLNTSITNQKSQIKNYITNYLSSVDDVFGITEGNKSKNDTFERFLSTKNTALKEQVEKSYNQVQNTFSNYDSMNDDQILQLLTSTSDMLKLAADSVNNSTPSNEFSQTTINTYYSTFIGGSNNLITLKSNLDSTISSIKTTSNSYDNQISTLNSTIQSYQNNVDNLKQNKGESAIISLDSSINTIISQIKNYDYSSSNIDQQIKSLNENKNIQINQLNNQILAARQNLSTLNNNGKGESIYAGTNGTIKEKKADIGNNVSPNTLICQISPQGASSLKLQIFSSQKLTIGQKFTYSKNGEQIGEGAITYELPFIDNTTQNNIYEAKLTESSLKDGDKIDIKLQKKNDINIIQIPIEFTVPKLEGYFVKKCESQDCKSPIESKIQVGSMNDGYIQILSGLNKGDIIGK